MESRSDNKIRNKLAQSQGIVYLCTAKKTDVRRLMTAASYSRTGGGIEPPTASAKKSGMCSGTACCQPCGLTVNRLRTKILE